MRYLLIFLISLFLFKFAEGGMFEKRIESSINLQDLELMIYKTHLSKSPHTKLHLNSLTMEDLLKLEETNQYLELYFLNVLVFDKKEILANKHLCEWMNELVILGNIDVEMLNCR